MVSLYSTAFFIPFTEISLHAAHEETDIMEVEGLLASVPPVVTCNVTNHQSSSAGICVSSALAQTPVVQHSSSECVLGPSRDTIVENLQMSDISYLAPTHTLQGVLKDSKNITNNMVINNSDLPSNSEEKQDVEMASSESNGCIVPNSTIIPNVSNSSEQMQVNHTMVTNDESLPSSPATSFEIFDDPDTRGLESGKQIADILRLLSASGQIQGIQLTASMTNETNPSSSNVFEASGVRAAEILNFLSASGQIQDIQLASSVETGNTSENLSETASKTSENILYLTSPSLSNVNLSNGIMPVFTSSIVDSNQIDNTPNVTQMRNSRIVLHVQDAPIILDPDKSVEALDSTINMVSPSILLPSTTHPDSSELSSLISGIVFPPSSQCADGIVPLAKDYQEKNWCSSPHNVPMMQQSDLNLVTPTNQVLFTVPNTEEPHSYNKAQEMRNVLKDIAKDADICRCNPCKCDPSDEACQVCNAETETETISDISVVSSNSSNTRKRAQSDVSHEKKLGALQVNTKSSSNDPCMTSEIGNQRSDSFSSHEHKRVDVESSTNEKPAEVESPHYGTENFMEIADNITLGESSRSAQTSHSYGSTNLDSWQNPGCSVDMLIVPHILPPTEVQNHREADTSENNNVEMDINKLSGSCECCGKNTNKTSPSEAESNNNGTNSREPCCVVVCLKTLEHMRRILDKGCCSGAENSLRALALQILSVKSSYCSGKQK